MLYICTQIIRYKKTKKMKAKALMMSVAVACCAVMIVSCARQTETAKSELTTVGNPFLPMWEHIPDGEPYVFEDPDRPGKQRVRVFLRTGLPGRLQYPGRHPPHLDAPGGRPDHSGPENDVGARMNGRYPRKREYLQDSPGSSSPS